MKAWIDSLFVEVLEDKSFSIVYYRSLPEFLRSELIRAIYESTNAGTIGLSEANIAEVHKFIG